MLKEHEIVLSLLQLALREPQGELGSGKESTLTHGVDWNKVIDFAIEQGVLGICFESLSSISSPEGKEGKGKGCPMDMDSLMEWFGQVEYQKAEYGQRLGVATRFAVELEKAGVRICVLKGLAYARYYRQPEMRYSCDFDCILKNDNDDDNDNCGFEIGNQVAERMGALVDRSEQKHSHVQLDGIHIENHQTCTGADSKGLEEYLSKFLFLPNSERLSGTALELPPLTFDALFCLYHAKTHFVVEEGIELRHVVDWVLIRRELEKQGLYDACVQDAERFGLNKFLESFNGMADLMEGKKALADLTESERLMWEDILRERVPVEHGKGWLRARLRLLKQMKGNSWKYRLYTDTTAWKDIYGNLRRYVLRVVRRPEVVKYMFGKKYKK